MENEYFDKIRKYGENVRYTVIVSFITLTPGRDIVKVPDRSVDASPATRARLLR